MWCHSNCKNWEQLILREPFRLLITSQWSSNVLHQAPTDVPGGDLVKVQGCMYDLRHKCVQGSITSLF